MESIVGGKFKLGRKIRSGSLGEIFIGHSEDGSGAARAGIVTVRVPKKVLQFAEIDDVFTSSCGSTKNLGNFVREQQNQLLPLDDAASQQRRSVV